jgi:hypothetical protein
MTNQIPYQPYQPSLLRAALWLILAIVLGVLAVAAEGQEPGAAGPGSVAPRANSGPTEASPAAGTNQRTLLCRRDKPTNAPLPQRQTNERSSATGTNQRTTPLSTTNPLSTERKRHDHAHRNP